MKKTLLVLLLGIALMGTTYGTGGVGINSTVLTSADTSASLDLSDPNKGFLTNRLTLTSTTDGVTIPLPALGLFIFNTGGALPKAFWYNSNTAASPIWKRLLDNTSGWTTNGNSGTTASTSAIGTALNNNFAGTIDSVDYVVGTGNLEAFRVKGFSSGSTRRGYLGIGTQNPTKPLQIVTGTSGNISFPISLWSNCVGCGNQYTGTGIKLSNTGAPGTNEDNGSVEIYAIRNRTGGNGDLGIKVATNSSMFEHLRIEGLTGYTSLYAATGTGTYTTGFRPSSALHILSTLTNAPKITLGVSANPSVGNVIGSIAAKIDTASANVDVASIRFTAITGWPGSYSNTDAPSAIGLWTTHDGTGTQFQRMSIAGATNGTAEVWVNQTSPYVGDVFSSTSDQNGDYGVNGYNTLTTATTGGGVYGETRSAGTIGVWGFNNNANGTGGLFVGQNVTGSTLIAGQGAAGTGNTTGGYFRNTSLGISQAIYSDNGGTICRVNYWNGATQYKILGTGTVSTTAEDLNGNRVVLHAPETPEIYFQDYGNGKLINGKAYIQLDPIITKNIVVNDKHPLQVFIQLNGDCKGVFVSNRTAAGFDVTELQGGNSNVEFTWTITANRADEMLPNGKISKNADARFEQAPADEDIREITAKVPTKSEPLSRKEQRKLKKEKRNSK